MTSRVEREADCTRSVERYTIISMVGPSPRVPPALFVCQWRWMAYAGAGGGQDYLMRE